MIPVLIYIGWFIFSTIAWKIFNRFNYGKFYFVRIVIGFVGVAVHEFSHAIACVLIGAKPVRIEVKHYRGAMWPDRNYSFAPGLLVSLAPLATSLWLLDWALGLFFTEATTFFQGLLLLGFMISLVVGGAPSSGDLLNCVRRFRREPQKSLVALGLIVVSFAISAYVFYAFEWFFLHDIFFLLAVIITYQLIKLPYRIGKFTIRSFKTRSRTKYSRVKPNYAYEPPLEDEY